MESMPLRQGKSEPISQTSVLSISAVDTLSAIADSYTLVSVHGRTIATAVKPEDRELKTGLTLLWASRVFLL